MSYEAEAVYLAEKNWKRVGDASVPLLAFDELTRACEIKALGANQLTAQAFCRAYIGVANFAAAPAAQHYFLTDPQATIGTTGPKTWTGKYRLARLYYDPKMESIIEVLRKGYATAISWDEAQLVDGTAKLARERTLAIVFRSLDPAYLNACVLSLVGTILTNPSIQGEAKTGTWAVTDVQPKQADDGSAYILLMLAKVANITALADLAAITPVQTWTRDIDHPFGKAGGYVTHAGQSSHDGILLTYTSISLSSRTVINAITDAQLQSLCPDASYEFIGKDLTEDLETHLLALRLAYRRVARLRWTDQAAHITTNDNPGTAHEGIQRAWLGIDKADEALVAAALIPGGSMDNLTGYTPTGFTYSDNDDGSMNWQQTLLKETKGALGAELEETKASTVDPHGLQSGAMSRITIVNQNLEALANAYAVLNAAATGYTLVDTEDQLQGNGLWAKAYIYEKPTWRAWASDLAPTTIDKGPPSGNGDTWTKTWVGIQKADLATAQVALLAGTPAAETGYKIEAVRVSDAHNGSVTLARIEKKSFSSTAASGQIIETQAVNPLGLVSGSLDTLTAEYDGFTIAELATYADSLPSGYTLVSTKQEPSGPWWKLTRVYNKATWTAWVNGATPTTIDKGPPSGNGDTWTKTWVGIQKADLATAQAALLAGTPAAETGYKIEAVRVSDAHNGSVTLARIEKKSFSSTAASGQITQTQAVNPLGLVSGSMDTLTAEYDGFTIAELATYADSLPSGYTLVSTKQEPSGPWWKLTRVYNKATWTAWVNGATPTTIDKGPPSGNGDTWTKTWVGIQKADLATAQAALLAGTPAAETGYKIDGVRVSDNHNGSVTLTRVEKKSFSSTAASAQIAATEIVNPLGLVSGTIDTIRAEYDGFTVAELAAFSDGVPSGYVVAIPNDVEPSGAWWKLVRVFKKATWTAWVNGATPTLSQDTASGTQEERRNREWHGIAKAGLSGAVAYLLTDASAPSGFISLSADASDRGDGSIILRQQVAKQASYTAADGGIGGTRAVDPHGRKPGTVTIKRARYDGFSVAELAAIATTPPASYKLVSSLSAPGLGGRMQREDIFELPAWDGTWATGKTLIRQQGDTGLDVVQIHEATGIPLADLATALSAAKTPDSGYILEDAGITDGPDGSVNASRRQRKAHDGTATSDAVTIQLEKANGRNAAPLHRIWFRRSAAAKVTLLAGSAVADDTGYLHHSVHVTDHGDTTFSITQTLVAYNTGHTTPNIVTSVEPEKGTRPSTAQRVWYRRNSADKEKLIGALGAAVTGFDVTIGGATTTYFHSGVRIQDNGDGTFDVIQDGDVTWVHRPGSRYDIETALVVEKDEIVAIITPSAGPQRCTRTISRQIFGTDTDAWTYAVGSGGTLSTPIYDSDGVARTQARVQYLGSSKWAGYNVIVVAV